MSAPTTIYGMLDEITDLWSPRIVARHNDTDMRVAKIHGEYIWHAHDQTDELFLVISGRLTIELRLEAGDVRMDLEPGEVYVVPKGTLHKPSAEELTAILMLETTGTLTTGDHNEGVPAHIPKTVGY